MERSAPLPISHPVSAVTPNREILVSQRLLGSVEELVEVEPVGELTLKGFHRPVTAHNILGLKG